MLIHKLKLSKTNKFLLNKLFVNNFRSKFFFSSSNSNKFNIFQEKIDIVYEKKLLLSQLLDNKIFHYALFGSETKELINLQNINSFHLDLLKKFKQNYKLSLLHIPTSCIQTKVNLQIFLTIGLVYVDFVKFIKNYNEDVEEKINDIIREMLEHNIDQEIIKTYLQKLRDDWRSCFDPEVLTEKFDPTYNTNILSKTSLYVNDLLIKIL